MPVAGSHVSVVLTYSAPPSGGPGVCSMFRRYARQRSTSDGRRRTWNLRRSVIGIRIGQGESRSRNGKLTGSAIFDIVRYAGDPTSAHWEGHKCRSSHPNPDRVLISGGVNGRRAVGRASQIGTWRRPSTFLRLVRVLLDAATMR